MKPPFVFLPHTADIKFQAFGDTINELFENVTKAVADYLGGGMKIGSTIGRVIQLQGRDKESLLYSYIDELLYLLDAENFVVSKALVNVRGNNLMAELYGDNAEKYHLQHIKAATYSEMEIKKKDGKWEALAVLDV